MLFHGNLQENLKFYGITFFLCKILHTDGMKLPVTFVWSISGNREMLHIFLTSLAIPFLVLQSCTATDLIVNLIILTMSFPKEGSNLSLTINSTFILTDAIFFAIFESSNKLCAILLTQYPLHYKIMFYVMKDLNQPEIIYGKINCFQIRDNWRPGWERYRTRDI